MTTADSAPRAEGVRWDLSPLCASADDCRERLARALDDCRAFETRYRGTVAAMEGPTLAAALAEMARIENEIGRLYSYASLRESVDVTDAENQDLNSLMERSMVEASNALRFFELEWLDLDEPLAEQLANAPEVAADRHHLIAARRFKRHTLTEPEERMLAERSPAAGTIRDLVAGVASSSGWLWPAVAIAARRAGLHGDAVLVAQSILATPASLELVEDVEDGQVDVQFYGGIGAHALRLPRSLISPCKAETATNT
jgi:hypothetical protein